MSIRARIFQNQAVSDAPKFINEIIKEFLQLFDVKTKVASRSKKAFVPSANAGNERSDYRSETPSKNTFTPVLLFNYRRELNPIHERSGWVGLSSGGKAEKLQA